MEVRLKKSFFKELKRCPQHIQLAVKQILETLEKSHSLAASKVDFKKIKGYDNYLRIRVGGYRIGCEYIAPQLVVITILSRGDVYKKFPPK